MTKPSLDDLKAFWLAYFYGVLAYAAVTLVVLVYQICWPKIITYPWKEEEKQIKRTVIFAASYNPPHHGHVRILEYLSKRYTKVIAVVGFNPNKDYLVSPEQRADLLRDMLKSTSATNNVEVDGESILYYRTNFLASD